LVVGGDLVVVVVVVEVMVIFELSLELRAADWMW